MKNLGESYFIYIIKPTLMITTFYINFQYIKKSEFPNEFYLGLYLLAFFIKPLFFLVLYIGLVMNLKIKSFLGYFMTLIIVSSIFLGLPIKEFSDYFGCTNLKNFFEGKEYNLNEYLITHFVVNLLIENIPIVLFVLINNNMLGKWKEIILDPIILNVFNMIFTIIIFYLFFGKKNVFLK